MSEITLMRTPQGYLVPADQQSLETVSKLKAGVGIKANFKKENNLLFHRKMFALANIGFDSWECPKNEYKGQEVEKNFDQFRDDITILAGFYIVSTRLDGSIRLTAKSWSFANMSQDQREQLYSEIINVLLKHILKRYTKDDLEKRVEEILRFA